jgi:serpin B
MRATVILLATISLLAACGLPSAEGPEGAELARSDAPLSVSDVPAADVAAVVEADTAFALDLLREAYRSDNLILSPFSVATALGMLEPGARGETRAEMAAMLHETLADDRLHPARGALLAAVNTASSALPEGQDDPFTLRAVDATWAQSGYPILPEFLDVLAHSYDAGAFLIDFAADPEAARRAINDWVAGQTEDRIEDLVPEGVIDPLTRLVLTNAVYFKASWEEQFDPAATADREFSPEAGEPVPVPFLHASRTLSFVEADGFRAAWIPYVGDASLMVLLPDGDLATLLAGLTPEVLAQATEARAGMQVDLALPKFEFRSELSLAEVLQSLGMRAAFDPGAADLTGIVAARELVVQDVVHQGFVKLDEQGTEAAAATAVVVGLTAAPVETVELVLDRPFLFLIRHDPTGEILFAGVVANPAA